jgi:hypothetical protein
MFQNLHAALLYKLKAAQQFNSNLDLPIPIVKKTLSPLLERVNLSKILIRQHQFVASKTPPQMKNKSANIEAARNNERGGAPHPNLVLIRGETRHNLVCFQVRRSWKMSQRGLRWLPRGQPTQDLHLLVNLRGGV